MSTNASPGAASGSRTHPAIIVAAVAVAAFAIVGIAAFMGWLPGAASVTTPAGLAPGQQVSGGVASEYPVPQAPEPAVDKPAAKAIEKPAAAPPKKVEPKKPEASKPQVASARPQPTTPAYGESKPASPQASAPAVEFRPAPKACANCGTVTSVTPIEQAGEGSGLGAVIGGVVGGVLGHQVGGGRGKDVATVAGAVGGAYAGHQIEKGQKKTLNWEVRVRLEDGTNTVVKYASEPKFRVGDKVRVEGDRLVRG